MKKLTLIIAIVFGIGLASFAEERGGGLFQRGAVSDELYYGAGYYDRNGRKPLLPFHELNENQPADDETPLGSGIAVLLGLGGAYLVGKKRK